ncbi:MAG: acyl carrier protein [Pseudomonas sp.]
MYLAKVKEIAANILFLDSSDGIDSNAPFQEIGFTSIDFIDFCYEIKAQISAEIEPHDIWPFAKLLVDPLFYFEGCWTEEGEVVVEEILDLADGVSVDAKSLDCYWTPRFCARRIEGILNV